MTAQKDFTMDLYSLLIASEEGIRVLAYFPALDVCEFAMSILSTTEGAPEMGCNPEPFTVFTPDQVASLMQ